MGAHLCVGVCTFCKANVKTPLTKEEVSSWAPDRKAAHAKAHDGWYAGHGPMHDAAGVKAENQVDVKQLADPLHAILNLVAYLLLHCVFVFLPPAKSKTTIGAARLAAVKRLKAEMSKQPVNLTNFGFQGEDIGTPSPNGPDCDTILWTAHRWLDAIMICPKGKRHAKYDIVQEAWRALLACHLVWSDPNIGDSYDERNMYKRELLFVAFQLSVCVGKVSGGHHSCVYFHAAFWIFPSQGFWGGGLIKDVTHAIEHSNSAIKRVNANGQRLANGHFDADGSFEGEDDAAHDAFNKKKRKLTVGATMQVVVAQELDRLLRDDVPLRIKMKRAHKMMNSGRRSDERFTLSWDKEACSKGEMLDLMGMR